MANSKRSVLLLALTLLLWGFYSTTAFSQSKKHKAKQDSLTQPQKSVTSGSVTTGGETIKYKAISGTMPIYNNQGEAIAAIGYTAYLKKGVNDPSQRPILFGYNGGPGSASIWVHMGALGPKRVKINGHKAVPPAPYQLVNNQYSPLDVTDVVIIDMVGAGYSRAVGDTENSYFWGQKHDIQSFSNFIIHFLSKHGRLNSPKYLFGESYGSFRSAGIANHLLGQGIALNGVVTLGTVFDLRAIAFGPNDNFPYVIYLPTYAAIAWHYDKIDTTGNLKDFVQKVKKFAVNTYMPALLKGDHLPSSTRTQIVNKLSSFIGLKKSFIKRANLRIRPSVFTKRILRNENKVVGRYDARFNGIAMNPVVNRTYYDPSSSDIGPAFKTMFLRYEHQILKFGQNRQFLFSARELPGFDWDWPQGGFWPTTPNTGPDLGRALKANPYLQVRVISGYFDTATPFFGSQYTISQLDLPDSLQNHVKFIHVKAGHMSYLKISALKKIHEVLAGLIE